MKLYWSLKSIPGFQGLPKDQLMKKWRFYYVKSFTHWGQWLGLFLVASSFFIALFLPEVAFPLVFNIQLSGIAKFGCEALVIVLGALLYQVCVFATIAHLMKGQS